MWTRRGDAHEGVGGRVLRMGASVKDDSARGQADAGMARTCSICAADATTTAHRRSECAASATPSIAPSHAIVLSSSWALESCAAILSTSSRAGSSRGFFTRAKSLCSALMPSMMRRGRGRLRTGRGKAVKQMSIEPESPTPRRLRVEPSTPSRACPDSAARQSQSEGHSQATPRSVTSKRERLPVGTPAQRLTSVLSGTPVARGCSGKSAAACAPLLRAAERQELLAALPSVDTISVMGERVHERTEKRKLPLRSPYGSFTPTNTLAVRSPGTAASAAAQVRSAAVSSPARPSPHPVREAGNAGSKRRKSLFDDK